MTIHRGLIHNKCTLNYHYSIESLIADIFCYNKKIYVIRKYISCLCKLCNVQCLETTRNNKHDEHENVHEFNVWMTMMKKIHI